VFGQAFRMPNSEIGGEYFVVPKSGGETRNVSDMCASSLVIYVDRIEKSK
jgi:hypothetical protein